MSIEAMKQWLKALEHSHANEPIWKTPHRDAIASLRQAIEKAEKKEPQPEPPIDENIFDAWVSASDSDGIAYDGPSFERGYRLGRGEYDEYTGALVADAIKQPQQAEKQEPVAWLAPRYEGGHENLAVVDKKEFGAFPVYTAPQQREWAGLTDEELDDCYDNVEWNTVDWCPDHQQLARAVEAKLKDKNT